MGLLEQIEKDEEELRKLEGGEESQADEQEETEQEKVEDDTENDSAEDNDEGDTDEDEEAGDTDDDGTGNADDDTDESENETDAKSIDEKAVKPETNDDFAKARIERREKLRKQREESEQRIREEQATQTVPQSEPVVETAEQRLDRIEARESEERLRTQAADELSAIEHDFMADNPDYSAATRHMIASMYNGAKSLYPEMTDKQATEVIKNKVLSVASDAARRGMNPAEVLYQISFDNYGYEPKADTQAAPETPAKPKADPVANLRKKAKNKKRSVNGLSGGGQNAGARVTIDEANTMTLGDFGNLSEAEMDELINQADS